MLRLHLQPKLERKLATHKSTRGKMKELQDREGITENKAQK